MRYLQCIPNNGHKDLTVSFRNAVSKVLNASILSNESPTKAIPGITDSDSDFPALTMNHTAQIKEEFGITSDTTKRRLVSKKLAMFGGIPTLSPSPSLGILDTFDTLMTHSCREGGLEVAPPASVERCAGRRRRRRLRRRLRRWNQGQNTVAFRYDLRLLRPDKFRTS